MLFAVALCPCAVLLFKLFEMPREVKFFWNFFDKLKSKHGEKRAKCRICKRDYIYTSTTYNLKNHLKTKHPEELGLPPVEKKDWNDTPRLRYSKYIWNYFSKDSSSDTHATCDLCSASIVAAPANSMKGHLQRKHEAAYEQLVKDARRGAEEDDSDSNVSDIERIGKYLLSI